MKILASTLALIAFVAIFKKCQAEIADDPKMNCFFDVIEPDGSKYTYDFSGHDYDMT